MLSNVKFWNLGSPSPLLSLVLVSGRGAQHPTLALPFSAWILFVGSVSCSGPISSVTYILYVNHSFLLKLKLHTQSRHHPVISRFLPQKLECALVWYALSVYRNPEAIGWFLIPIPTNDCLVLEDFWKPLRMPACWTPVAQPAVKDQPLLWLKMRWPCSAHRGQPLWIDTGAAFTGGSHCGRVSATYYSSLHFSPSLGARPQHRSLSDFELWHLDTFLQLNSITLQFSSVAQSCPALYDLTQNTVPNTNITLDTEVKTFLPPIIPVCFLLSVVCMLVLVWGGILPINLVEKST